MLVSFSKTNELIHKKEIPAPQKKSRKILNS